MYKTKAASQSVTVIAQVIAIVGMVLKMAGVDISSDLTDVPAHAGDAIDAVMILVAELTALYGRLRANTKIISIFKPKT